MTVVGGFGGGKKFRWNQKNPRQKFLNFWCFKHEIKLSDTGFKPNGFQNWCKAVYFVVVIVVVVVVFFLQIFGDKSQKGGATLVQKKGQISDGGTGQFFARKGKTLSIYKEKEM